MLTTSAAAPPAVVRPGRRAPYALLGIALGYFMVLLDMTVLSVAEPDLVHSLGGSVAGLQWAVTGYTVAFGALLLSAGAAADRYGAHRLFRGGIAAFGAVSLLCAAAPGWWTLVALRALLGVAAAACVPSSMAMITRLYPDAARRARAVAVWAAVSGSALAAGPIVGGLLVSAAGWRSVFLVNAPLAVVVLALTAGRGVRCPLGERRIDWTGQWCACAALALGTDAVIALGAGAWAHGGCSGGVAVLLGAAFVRRERRSAAPVLPRAVLAVPGMGRMLLAGAAVNFAMTGVLFVLPLLFERRFGYGAVRCGLAFLPMTVPFAVNPLLTGRLVARVGARGPILAGLLLLGSGGGVMGGAVFSGAPYPVLAAGLVAAGFGVSLALPALVTAVVAGAAPLGAAGAAGGLLNAARQGGATLGVAVLGALAPGTALVVAGAVCGVAVSALLVRERAAVRDRVRV